MHRKQTVYRRYETKSRSTLPDYIGVIEQYRERRKAPRTVQDWQKPEGQRRPMADGFEVSSHELQLGYWRKHPNLHGYIVQEFADGKDECQKIELAADDIRKIIEAVRANMLPETQGFFFGTSEDDPPEEDIKILEAALKWVETKEEGVSRSVHYRASW